MKMFEHDYKKFPELTNTQIQEFGFSSPHPQITTAFDAVVVKVHDGDTVTLRTSFRDFDFPLRFLDIDAPELSEGGDRARDWLRNRIIDRKVHVMIDWNNRVGKYGRLLGRVFSGGLCLNDQMVHLGLVVPFGRKKEGWVPDKYMFFGVQQWF